MPEEFTLDLSDISQDSPAIETLDLSDIKPVQAGSDGVFGAFVEGAARQFVSTVDPRAADELESINLAEEDTLAKQAAAGIGQGVAQATTVGAFTATGAGIGALFGVAGAIPGAAIGAAAGLGVTLVQGMRRELFGVDDDTKREYKRVHGVDAPPETLETARDNAFWGLLAGEAADTLISAATAGAGKIVTKGAKPIVSTLLKRGTTEGTKQYLKSQAAKQAVSRIGALKNAGKAAAISATGEFAAEGIQTGSAIAATQSAVHGTSFTSEAIKAASDPATLRAATVGAISAGTVRGGASITGADRITQRILTKADQKAQELSAKTADIPVADTLDEGLAAIEESMQATEEGVSPSESTEKAIATNAQIAEIENADNSKAETVINKDQMDSAAVQEVYGSDPNLVVEALENGDTRVMVIPGAPTKYEQELADKQVRIDTAQKELSRADNALTRHNQKIAVLTEQKNELLADSQTLTQDPEASAADVASNSDKILALDEQIEELRTEGTEQLTVARDDIRQTIANEETTLFGTSRFEDPTARFEKDTDTSGIQVVTEEDASTNDAVKRIRNQVRFETFSPGPKSKLLQIFNSQRKNPEQFMLTFQDSLRQKFDDRFRPFQAAVQFAQTSTGKTEVRPSEDPMMLLRLYAGKAAQFNSILKEGMVDIDRNVATPGGFNWLLEPYSTVNRQDASDQLQKTVSYMLAQRVQAKAQKRFKESEPRIRAKQETAASTEAAAEKSAALENLPTAERRADLAEKQFAGAEELIRRTEGTTEAPIAGIAAAAKTDLFAEKTLTEEQIARDALTQLESDPAIAIIKEGAERYRTWANANLDLMLDGGLITEDTYNAVKDNNAQYVAMQRIFEATDGSDLNEVAKNSSNIGSAAALIHQFKGSARTIKDPYQSLIESSARIVQEVAKNEVKNAFVNAVDPRGLSKDVAAQLNTIGRQVDKGNPNTITVMREGVREFWELDKDVAATLNGLDDRTSGPLMDAMAIMPTILRNTITYAPPFAVRNKIRDTVSRQVVSRTTTKGAKVITDPNELQKIAEQRGDLTVEDLQRFGGGFAGFYMRDIVDYHRAQKAALNDKNFRDTTVLVKSWESVGKAADTYKKIIEYAETSTRMNEFRSAYSKARTELGYSDRDAKIYASYQSRDLIDFAVAGEWIRDINRLVPFTNAAIRGTVKATRSFTEDPRSFMMRWGLYAVTPVLAERAFNMLTGNEDDYDQLPAYQKDLFWNFRVGPNTWLRIPKPFEIGALASGVGRLFDKIINGDDKAFEGFAGTLAKNLLPVDEAAMAGPFQGFMQALANKDFFRNKHIVPYWESKLDKELRDPKGASTAATVLGSFADATGLDTAIGDQLTDPRVIDFLAQQQFGNVGKAVSAGSDVRSLADLKDFGNRHLIGLAVTSPLRSSRDLNFVLDFAERRGVGARNKKLKLLKVLMTEYYNASEPAEKKKLFDEAIDEAKFIREQIEEVGDVYFGK